MIVLLYTRVVLKKDIYFKNYFVFYFLTCLYMRNTKKAFTLVELIVVITILAILATIAFISLQGYSQEAKNSKVVSDLRTMVSAIETGVTKGNFSLSNVVTDNASGTYDVVGTAEIAYVEGTSTGVIALTGTGVIYKAGTLDFTAIGQSGDDFKDPEGENYLAWVAAYGSTSYYQLVGQTKSNAGIYTAVVKGNYVNRFGATADGLVADGAGSLASDGITNNLELSTTGIY